MRFLCFLLCMGSYLSSIAQTDSVTKQQFIDTSAKITPFVTIGAITIKGNKRTKPYIILREMVLHQGDSISIKDLNKKLAQSRNQVFNTALFVEVVVYAAEKAGSQIIINVDVKERWYFFPLPHFFFLDNNWD